MIKTNAGTQANFRFLHLFFVHYANLDLDRDLDLLDADRERYSSGLLGRRAAPPLSLRKSLAPP